MDTIVQSGLTSDQITQMYQQCGNYISQNDIVDAMVVMNSIPENPASASPQASQASIDEKARISAQKVDGSFDRPDFFGIGTVYLRIPPTQISISNEAHNYRFSPLRGSGEVVFSSGRSTTRVELEIMFTGMDDINSKLRPLLAQFRTTPFLPIQNDYLRNIINPLDSKVVDMDYLKSQEQLLSQMQQKESLVQQLSYLSSKQNSSLMEINEYLTELVPDARTRKGIMDVLQDPRKYMSIGETTADEFNWDGSFDVAKYLDRKISIPTGDDLLNTRVTLSDIANVYSTIESLKREVDEKQTDAMIERFQNKQMVGVLSQLTLNTVPGFPDTLRCGLSLYLFNYDPYSMEYGFVSGYTQNTFTTDITKCDLFIDWYSKRWLANSSDPVKPGLLEYTGDATTSFLYATRAVAGDVNAFSDSNTLNSIFEVNNGLYLTGITLSIKNIIQFIPILSLKTPTCQYLGSPNNEVQFTFESDSISKIKEMSAMIERLGILARNGNRLTRNTFVKVNNEILQLAGLKYFIINDFNVDTIPGSPGSYNVSLNLLEYRVDSEKFQMLNREGVTSEEEIEAAAEYIIDQAHKYLISGKKLTGLPLTYYNMVLGSKSGWLSSGNIVANYVNGCPGGGDNTSMQLRDKIIKSSEGLVSNTPTDITAISVAMSMAGSTVAKLLNMSPIISPGKAIAQWAAGERAFSPGVITHYTNNGQLTKDFYSGIYYNFEPNFVESMGDRDDINSFYSNNLSLMAQVCAIMKRDSIVDAILNTNANPGLNDYLNNKTDSKTHQKFRKPQDIDASKLYCYPDLDLPRFKDLPGGFQQMSTLGQAGLPATSDTVNNYAQTTSAVVDPDFYMYKGSLWGVLDDIYSTTQYVEDGITNWKSMANSNRVYRNTKAPSEVDWAKLISNAYAAKTDDKLDSKASATVPAETADQLIGQVATVTNVTSGNSCTLDIAGKSYPFKFSDFSASTSDARSALGTLIMGQQVEITYANSLGSDGTIMGDLSIVNSGTDKDGTDVGDYMLTKAAQLGLSYNPDADDPADFYAQEKFLGSWEAWLKTETTTKNPLLNCKLIPPSAKPVVQTVTSAAQIAYTALNPASAGTSDILTSGIANWLSKTFSPANADSNNEAKTRESIAIAATALAKNANPEVVSNLLGVPLTNNIPNLIAQKFTQPTNNNGLARFDRESDLHIDIVKQKIRENQKDNVLRMTRAFPTFKIYFYEENLPEWGRLNNYYSYDAVQSIEITKSRTDPADTAIVTFFNTKGTLDISLFGLYDKNGIYQQRGYPKSYDPKKQQTRDEENLEDFVIQAGTLIKIKMGYCSDPDLMDTVFTGMVAEFSGSDMITVVAQGFGVELLLPVPDTNTIVASAAAFQLLDRIISTPDTLHFGKLIWLPRNLDHQRQIYRRQIPDTTHPGQFMGASWWRNIGGIEFLLNISMNYANANIYTYESSCWYNLCHGGWQSYITKDMSIWDVFRDMMKRYPGYITTVVPFDDRATIYFGPSEFLYWFTDQQFQQQQINWDQMLKDKMTKTPEEKIQSLLNDYGWSQLTPSDAQSNANAIGNFFSQLMKNPTDTIFNGITSIAHCIPLPGGATGITYPSSEDRAAAQTSLATNLKLAIENSNIDDANMDKLLNSMSNSIKNGRVPEVSISVQGDKVKVQSNVGVGNNFYMDTEGNHYDSSAAVKQYDNIVWNNQQKTDPQRKLIRNYHYKDSFHHIIANNIVATAKYMYNKVTVEYPLENSWDAIGNRAEQVIKFNYRGPASHQRISVQIDDDIWPEKIKEKIVQEKNAKDTATAWLYGLGNLGEEMRKMYSGTLIILGDPNIKPYDIVMISDYYNEMSGPIEVEQVTHHFTPETGFITTIVPNLLSYVNNTMQQGSVVVASAYHNSYADFLTKAHNAGGLGIVIPPLGASLARCAFWLTGLSTDRREPVSFTPLIWAERPYVAGIQGMRKTGLVEAIAGNISRFRVALKNNIDYQLRNLTNFRLRLNQTLNSRRR